MLCEFRESGKLFLVISGFNTYVLHLMVALCHKKIFLSSSLIGFIHDSTIFLLLGEITVLSNNQVSCSHWSCSYHTEQLPGIGSIPY